MPKVVNKYSSFSTLAKSIKSISYLCVVTTVVILGLAMALFGIRLYGFMETTAPMVHPLTSQGFLLIARSGGGAEAPENTIHALDQVSKMSQSIVLHLDVRQCRDDLVLMRDDRLDRTTNAQGRVLDFSAKQLAQLDAAYSFLPENHFPLRGKGLGVPTLREALHRYPKAWMILDIHSDTRDIHKEVMSLVDEFHAGPRVLLQSDYDVVLSAIKESRPQWLFGTGIRDLTRTQILSSIFLETVAPILGDVFVTPVEVDHHEVLPERIIREVHRRGKKIIAGPINDSQGLMLWRQKGLDGIMTDRPSALWHDLALKR